MKKKGFTLIEIISTVVILGIIFTIVSVLVLGIIRRTKDSANKRNIDLYGKMVETAMAEYQSQNLKYPDKFEDLIIEYTGPKVECNISRINPDHTVYLSDCKVNNKLVSNYHYGTLILIAVKYLLKKTNDIEITNYTDGNTHEMYTFEHDETVQTPALTDYRYIGNEPYNYVEFNGNELWRIIGVFDTEDVNGNYEKRIKIVKNTRLGKMAWDENNTNEWSTATLNTYLNGEYYNSIDILSQKMIDNTKYYLGSFSGTSGANYYNSERGNTVYNGRSINWIGKIALIYPSDYLFPYAYGADDTCYNSGGSCNSSSGKNNSWFHSISINDSYQWVLTPYSGNNNTIPFIAGSIYLNAGVGSNNSMSIRPTLYLSPKVKIISGDGTIDNPYEFEL